MYEALHVHCISFSPPSLFSHLSNKYLLSVYYVFNFKLYEMWGVPWGTHQTRSISFTGVEEIEIDIQVTQHMCNSKL